MVACFGHEARSLMTRPLSLIQLLSAFDCLFSVTYSENYYDCYVPSFLFHPIKSSRIYTYRKGNK